MVINEYVRPININENYDPDISCVVSGWGFTEEGGEKSGVLHFVTVPIIKKPICNEAYEGMIKDGMICAGYMGGGRDACQVKLFHHLTFNLVISVFSTIPAVQ